MGDCGYRYERCSPRARENSGCSSVDSLNPLVLESSYYIPKVRRCTGSPVGSQTRSEGRRGAGRGLSYFTSKPYKTLKKF